MKSEARLALSPAEVIKDHGTGAPCSIPMSWSVGETAARPGAPRKIRGARTWAKGAIAISRQLVSDAHAMPVNGKVGLVEHRADNCRGCFAARSWIGRSLRSVIADATRLREFELGRARTVTLMHVAVECRGARR